MEGYTGKTFPDTLNESNYDARTNYLNVMKQFMAHSNENNQSFRDKNLDNYFQYEKELSLHIQEMLNQCT